MGQGYEAGPQAQATQGGSGAGVEAGGGQCGAWRDAARGMGHSEGEAMLVPPPDPKAAALIKKDAKKGGTLTQQIAPEEQELAEFECELAKVGVALPKPGQLFLDARRRYLAGDPRMHTLAGQALGVDGTWPTPALIAAVCGAQKRGVGGKKVAVTGYFDLTQLETKLAASTASVEIRRNTDLFGKTVARSDRDGKRPEDPAKRALYRAHTEPSSGSVGSLARG